MKGSLRIGTVAGTGVFLHWSFLLLFGWLFVRQAADSGVLAALETLLFVAAVFLCVTLHEIGHATMARRFGIGTQDITLLPIGGVARLRRIPEEPRKELLIALAGPVVNVVIAAGLYVGMWISGLSVMPIEGKVAEASFLVSMFWFNVVVVAFNMLPAFPMDGGRVFRALLARRRGYAEATQTAAKFGQAIATVFIVLGVMNNWLLAFVGVFVYLGAMAEAKAVEIRTAAAGATAADAMLTRLVTLDDRDLLGDAVDALLSGPQSDFPVLRQNGTTGLLTRSMLLKELKTRGPSASLVDVVTAAAPSISAGLSLELAMDALAECRGPLLVVNSLAEPVGLLTPENVQEWILVQAALDLHSTNSTHGSRQRPSSSSAFDEPLLEELADRNRFTFPPA